MARSESETLALDGHEVTISNPDKIFFADAGITKIDLVRYYLAVADGTLVGVRDRPMALKRFVDGAEGEAVFQKRAPKSVPDLSARWSSRSRSTEPPTRWSLKTPLRSRGW